MELNPGKILIWFVIFLLSLTVHECAHAFAAEKSGDPTGRYLGRITLNPIPHIDILGTVIFPLIAMTSGGMMFGWAKPVPFNPMNLRDRRMGEILIALAGPFSNILLVILFMIVARLYLPDPSISFYELNFDTGDPVAMLLNTGIQLNVVLAVFNLIPIPPLDGHHVLRNILPDSLAEAYAQIPDMVGFAVLIILIYVGFTSMLINPVLTLVYTLLSL
ncbi:MAG: site-2 protease family protein [Blastocatellia bacterium]|nr:site-2 protease family protein [Blastocatellia bacterium]MBO0801131.1 site-2 protease family protein [Blastocatellia bacterium]